MKLFGIEDEILIAPDVRPVITSILDSPILQDLELSGIEDEPLSCAHCDTKAVWIVTTCCNVDTPLCEKHAKVAEDQLATGHFKCKICGRNPMWLGDTTWKAL